MGWLVAGKSIAMPPATKLQAIAGRYAFERLSLDLPERSSRRLVQQGVLTAYWRSPRALAAQVAFTVINPLLRGVR